MLGSNQMREAYAQRVVNLLRNLKSRRDRVIILLNKVDEESIYQPDNLNVEALKNLIFKDTTFRPVFNQLKTMKYLSWALKHRKWMMF